MKKLVSMLTALALLLCACAALAEGDDADDPEGEAYVGLWAVDDYILEILPADTDAALFDCVVTRYGQDGTGDCWSYTGCAYDDVGRALSSLEVGVHAAIALDDEGEWIPGLPDYGDGAAAFALNEDGTLTWTDFKQVPGGDALVFERVETEIENPVAAFEGRWVSDRAELTIEDLDDAIYCTVRWGSGAFEVAEWSYEAGFDGISGTLVTFETGVKRIVTYGEDGEEAASEVEYEDGAASFALNEDGTLTWTDFKQAPGENALVFERAAE